MNIFIYDSIEFKTTTVRRDKEGHYTVIKYSVQQEDIAVTNLYASNVEAPKFIKWTLSGQK